MQSALHTFLQTTRAQFLAGPSTSGQAAVAAIGNVAGDLDSIVSAVCLAFLQTAAQPEPRVVPALPFNRDDFRLRQDAGLLFRHCGLAFDGSGAVTDLVYLDELATPGATWRAGDAALGVALVDHNRIAPGVSALLGDQ
eukprot:6419654-Prymnesium_polylepis.1